MQASWHEARDSLSFAQCEYAKHANASRQILELQVNDIVLLKRNRDPTKQSLKSRRRWNSSVSSRRVARVPSSLKFIRSYHVISMDM